MPEDGIQFLKKDSLLSYEELLRLMGLLAHEGISKIRITGGEPFLRKEKLPLLQMELSHCVFLTNYWEWVYVPSI